MYKSNGTSRGFELSKEGSHIQWLVVLASWTIRKTNELTLEGQFIQKEGARDDTIGVIVFLVENYAKKNRCCFPIAVLTITLICSR